MSADFVMVYCKCPLEVLIERDVKGLYKKAQAKLSTLSCQMNLVMRSETLTAEEKRSQLVGASDTAPVRQSLHKVASHDRQVGPPEPAGPGRGQSITDHLSLEPRPVARFAKGRPGVRRGIHEAQEHGHCSPMVLVRRRLRHQLFRQSINGCPDHVGG